MSLHTPVHALLQRPPNEVPIGLVGASNARHKYGNIILRDLVQKGYPVLPINPTGTTVEGRPAVTSPLELETPVSTLNFLVRPEVGSSGTSPSPVEVSYAWAGEAAPATGASTK